MSSQWWWLRRLLASTDDGVEDVVMPTIPPEPTHPYYPPGVGIPAYAANEAPVPVLLAALAGTLGFTVLSAALVARKLNPRLGASGLAVFCWFLMNTCLHCVFEGYFVLNHATLASSQSLLAQLWKEYALSDSRYLTSDFFMLSVESITVFFWGPLCLANAIATARNSPSRHPLRIIACVTHLYGVALYYATSQCEFYFTGRSHSRPEFVYFWVYYVGFNLPWAIVPAFLLLDSVKTITRAMRALDKADATLSSHRIRTYGDVVGGQAESKKMK
ncbi:Emopamil binding protein-domain-containing protein [Xylaria arbuscula]|nr:Emopamil binding protein-domain-containing protein [Xylaria arbuscula]